MELVNIMELIGCDKCLCRRCKDSSCRKNICRVHRINLSNALINSAFPMEVCEDFKQNEKGIIKKLFSLLSGILFKRIRPINKIF